MKRILNAIWSTMVELQKIRVATALARMGKHTEAKEAIQ